MTHLLLAALITCPLHAGLSFLLGMIVMIVAEALRAALDMGDGSSGAPLSLLASIGADAPDAHGAGRAERSCPSDAEGGTIHVSEDAPETGAVGRLVSQSGGDMEDPG
jgi:hypothetical protein